MFILSLSIASGAPITPMDAITKNLIPVTLGNIVGGSLCVATTFSLTYGSLGKQVSHFLGNKVAAADGIDGSAKS